MQNWLIDTNIVSEMMRDPPNEHVLRWLNANPIHCLFIASVSVMELRFGLERLPEGRRRHQLEVSFHAVVTTDFAGRVLNLDLAAADAAGIQQARNQAMGRTVDVNDTMIAGIAISNRMGIATRNTADFHNLDVPVLNPFDAQP